jgi:hypothetical protein
MPGLNKDIDPKFLEPSNYTYALNSIQVSDEDIAINNITEPGNELCYSLLDGHEVIGSVTLDTDEVLLFTTNNVESKIYIQNDCDITEIINADCLNFKKTHFISAFFRIIKGCERVVYFTDGLNNYRSLNIDRIEDYGTPNIDCNLLNHFYQYEVPSLEEVSIIENSGILKPGSYEFAIQIGSGNWVPLTKPIPIFKDNGLIGAHRVKGNQNKDFYDPYDGGIPNTLKAIKLSINSSEKYNLAVIKYLEGLGTVTEVAVIKDIEGSEFLYTGTEDQLTTDLADIILDNLIISKAHSHSLVENRLILGNVEQPSYNWAHLQMQANNITSKYVVSQLYKKLQSREFYLQADSFMRDEVYAFGIVWIMKDGTVSPVFHIPGRTKDIPINNTNGHPRPDAINFWDSDTINSSWDSKDYDGFPSNPERWEVYNTAIKDDTPEQGYYSSGEFAYYSNNIDYPDVEYCDPDSGVKTRIYPTGKIRYHKFPDGTLEPHHSEENIHKLGVLFDNIDAGIYNSQVQGYYIVVNKPTSTSQTIVAKGLLFNGYKNLRNDQEVSLSRVEHVHKPSLGRGTQVFSWSNNTPTKVPDVHFFISPEHLLGQQYLNGTHYKVDFLDKDGVSRETISRVGYMYLGSSIQKLTYSAINRAIVDTVNLGFTSAENGFPAALPYGYTSEVDDTTIVSNATSSSILVSKLNNSYDQDFLADNTGISSIPYVAMKNNIPIFTNIDSIQYVLTTPKLSTDSTFTTFRGDTYINHFTINYGYNGVYSDTVTDPPPYRLDIVTFYVESRFNLGLRHEGIDCNEIFLPTDNDRNYMERNPLYLTDRSIGCDEFLDINKDYSTFSNSKIFIPTIYDESCTPSCDFKLPNYVYYSEPGASEDTSDNLRDFRINNYTIIPKESGSITNLFIYKENLYAQTERSLWMIPANQQSIQTDITSIYLGNANFFSIPPKMLSEIGNAGTRDNFSCLVTDFGVVFVDEYNRKIYLYSAAGFKDISQGLSRYLKNALSLSEKEVLRDNQHKGYQLVYDRFYQRILITSKNFEPILEYKTDSNDFNQGDFVFYKGKYGFWDGSKTVNVDFNDPIYFVNKSFTLSYDLMQGGWSSFHSYLPKNMYSNKDRFFTTVDSSVWKHSHDRNFTNYYGEKKDYIIELVNNSKSPFITKVNQTIKFIAEVEEFDDLANSWKEKSDVMFDKMWVYNNDQSSGIKNLVNKNNTQHMFTSINFNTDSLLEKEEKYWNINGFRDLSTSSLILDRSWNTIKNDYFIDYLPTNIDTSMSYYNQSRFRDKYLKVRLFFNHVNDYRLKISLLNVQSLPGESK